jgi:hypothetical protein
MAENIIFPDAPLFMVDRGWNKPYKDPTIQVVPLWGKKKSHLPRRRQQPDDPTIFTMKRLATEGGAFERDAKRTGPANGSSVSSPSAQDFEFVNVAGSFRDRDPEVRKLVRSHVMKGSHRNQKPRRKPVQKSKARSIKSEISSPARTYYKPETETTVSKLSLVFPGSTTSFYGGLPCPMEPHYYNLLNYCERNRESERNEMLLCSSNP